MITNSITFSVIYLLFYDADCRFKKRGAVLNPRYDHQVVVQCRLIRVLNLGPYRCRFGLIPVWKYADPSGSYLIGQGCKPSQEVFYCKTPPFAQDQIQQKTKGLRDGDSSAETTAQSLDSFVSLLRKCFTVKHPHRSRPNSTENQGSERWRLIL